MRKSCSIPRLETVYERSHLSYAIHSADCFAKIKAEVQLDQVYCVRSVKSFVLPHLAIFSRNCFLSETISIFPTSLLSSNPSSHSLEIRQRGKKEVSARIPSNILASLPVWRLLCCHAYSSRSVYQIPPRGEARCPTEYSPVNYADCYEAIDQIRAHYTKNRP